MYVPSKPICMAVLHFEGRFYRAYEGPRSHNHVLEFEEPFFPPYFEIGLDGTLEPLRSESVLIKVDGHRLYGGSGQFCVMPGRRYPNVEHWFVDRGEGKQDVQG